MTTKRRAGESTDTYSTRRWEASELLETLAEQMAVLNALVVVHRDAWSAYEWTAEGEQLKIAAAREVVRTCQELAARWDWPALDLSGRSPDDLPF